MKDFWPKFRELFFLGVLAFGGLGCFQNPEQPQKPIVVKSEPKGISNPPQESEVQTAKPTPRDELSQLMDAELADGFDFPFGDGNGGGAYVALDTKTRYPGWYVATHFLENYPLGIHPGEDWNGTGGGDTDLGQPVFAAAAGVVIHAGDFPSPWGKIVVIRHRYHENGEVKSVDSQYSHLLEMTVRRGDRVFKRQNIGSVGKGNNQEHPAHLHFEIRKNKMQNYPANYWPTSHQKGAAWIAEHYEAPSGFIHRHRNIKTPHNEAKLLVCLKQRFKCFQYEKGIFQKEIEVALGQEPVGHKEIEGDLKVPEGTYRVCEKSRGPFDTSNWVNAYLGTRWIRLDYPNPFDAARGLEADLISDKEYQEILKAHEQKRIPPKSTKLGGGIGIHGWLEKGWSQDKPRALTWGCISMNRPDLEEFYEWADLNTTVIITK